MYESNSFCCLGCNMISVALLMIDFCRPPGGITRIGNRSGSGSGSGSESSIEDLPVEARSRLITRSILRLFTSLRIRTNGHQVNRLQALCENGGWGDLRDPCRNRDRCQNHEVYRTRAQTWADNTVRGKYWRWAGASTGVIPAEAGIQVRSLVKTSFPRRRESRSMKFGKNAIGGKMILASLSVPERPRCQ